MTKNQIKALEEFLFKTEASNARLTQVIKLLNALGLELILKVNK